MKPNNAPREDDPEWDATDFAHPAWWRGSDYTVDQLASQVNEILDGKDDMSGYCQEPWQTSRKRIFELKSELEKAKRLIETNTANWWKGVDHGSKAVCDLINHTIDYPNVSYGYEDENLKALCLRIADLVAIQNRYNILLDDIACSYVKQQLGEKV